MFTPTAEQAAARDLFLRGEGMVITAGAGTGKTSALELIARSTQAHGFYVAFNKSIVEDVRGKMPRNVSASTAHGLAWRGVGREFQQRVRSRRMRNTDLADALDIRSYSVKYGKQTRVLREGYLAGMVKRAVDNFCKTTDERPTAKHVPYIEGIEVPQPDGTRSYAVNNAVAKELEPALVRMWDDIRDPHGKMPFGHHNYLKLWQLSHPFLRCDFILFDEAQDANPVMAAVVEEQEHAQVVFVGDSAQAIYEFTGAIDALAKFKTSNRAVLSHSFRFGQAIADEANVYLFAMAHDLRLTGTGDSTVGALDDHEWPDAILTRTNAGALDTLFDAVERGMTATLVGDGKELRAFCLGARELQERGYTKHHDLACFGSWNEVLEYVDHEVQGDELRLGVMLIEKYGCSRLLGALHNLPDEDDVDLVISTAHKAKGREWPVVQIHEDFEDKDPNAGDITELRLRYVAVTRAREHLDHSALTPPGAPGALALPIT